MIAYKPSATVVSLVPFPVHREVPGMTPTEFHIPAAEEGKVSVLLIQGCKHGVYLDGDRPTLIVPTAPEEVAQAVCSDWKKGLLGVQIGVAEPGLFWLPGDFTGESKMKEARATYRSEFEEADRLQLAWFKILVELADDAWGKFRQRAMISKLQKVAALRLKLTRDWLLDMEVEQAMSECPVCFEKVNPKAILCRHCDAVLNPTEFEKVKFAGKAAPAAK